VTAVGEVIVVGAAEHTAAYCAAVTVVMVEEDLATCGMEGSHDLGFGHLGAFRQDPSLWVSCPEACRCSVDDGAFGQVEVACVAGPWEKEPYCSVVGVTVGDMPEEPWAVLVSVVSAQPYHTGCWAW
jgi:hypothetical protein